MKKLLLTVILVPTLLYSQYYGERSTEQSFEQSDLYLDSHYLNTYGLLNFRDVSVGLIDDPFLNLYLNPANLPKLGKDNALLYLDFRGDRTSSPIVDEYIYPNYLAADLAFRPNIVDPRWNSVTRSEPEPILSLGILTYPIKDIAKDFFLGGTYQFIHREEKFYTVPYWIYNPLYYYDSFGARAEGLDNIPIEDRLSSKDEMMTDGHLYSLFTGYQISQNLSIGLSLNGIIHERSGGYLNERNDEYSTNQNNNWESSEEQSRDQDYNHIDFSAGINYYFEDKLKVGIKAGALSGKAEQIYNSSSHYEYKNNTPFVSPSWSYSFSNSYTKQTWDHDGTSIYIGINFSYKPSEGKSINSYYRYTDVEEDLLSSSNIIDTSYYTSRWINDNNNTVYNYLGESSTKDLRKGSGIRNKNTHEALFSFSMDLTKSTILILGAYWNSFLSTIKNSEPVSAIRTSGYYNNSSGGYNYNYEDSTSLAENKRLEWEYSSDYWSLQIPVLLQFNLSDNFGIMLGINRIIKGWKINDKTTAIFSLRERIHNGEREEETDFGERYTQPNENVTENETKLIAKLNLAVSPSFKVNFLIDPEFEQRLRVAQWWLSFEARL